MHSIFIRYTRNRPQNKIIYTKDIFKAKNFIIGDFTYGEPEVLFSTNKSNLIIGKYCSLAKGVKIFLGGNHRTDWVTTYPFCADSFKKVFPEASTIAGHPATKGDVNIGNDVWIGADATIMSGVSIGNGAVIAARSVVTKNIGDYEIWGGNPARLLKNRFSKEQIKRLNQIQWWDWEIEKIREQTHLLCSDEIDTFLNEHQIDQNDSQ